jgi:phosphate transport system permease protein
LLAHKKFGKIIIALLWLSATISVGLTLGILILLLTESFQFFKQVPISNFLFSSSWSPGDAASSSYGILPLITGSFLITAIALIVATPLAIRAAVYLNEYASSKMRRTVKPFIELLAGIPTVVYGFFAAVFIAPMIHVVGSSIGLDISSESALAAGIVVGIMLIPYIFSLTDDAIHAVPKVLRDASLGLGATKHETIKNVILPAAFPNILAGIILAISRALGETMIVVMAAGLMANLTFNPLDSVTTFTVQILTLITGDQDFSSPQSLSAYALGLTLFLITFGLNALAILYLKKSPYRGAA